MRELPSTHIGPPVCRPQPVIAVVQLRVGEAKRRLVPAQPKIYPNLNPAAALKVDRSQILKLHSFFDFYRAQRGESHGQVVPNSKYIFVRMSSGEMLMHPTHRHPVLAEGRPVLYAGEAYFDNGKLQWWSNGSGNYRPDAEHALQADLPMERFCVYEHILKG